jgi:hypothetical protein
MTMANGMWTAPRAGAFENNPFAVGNSPFTKDQKPQDPDVTARERREQGLR